MTATPGAPGTFTEPGATPPVPTGHTINDVMSKAPVKDDTNGASIADVLSGKTFWGLTGVGWGLKTGTYTCPSTATGDAVVGDVLTGKTFSNSSSNGITGTMANKGGTSFTPTTAAQTIAAGYYDGSGSVSGDADLVTGNIRSGVNIFGVSGKTEVVDTTEATSPAAAGNILSGRKAFVNGAAVTGTVTAGSNVTGTAGSLSMTIPDGLYSGAKTATANDPNLVAANIVSTKTIFGVTGSASVAAYPGAVPKTGKNDDGGFGVAFPSPRFTVNLGTVKDNLTGLVWLKNANCAGATRTWTQALDDVASLNTAGTMNGNACGDTSNAGSHQTDWRLPNKNELRSLLHYGYANPALSNTLGNLQWASNDPFDNVQSNVYWSSNTELMASTGAWVVDLGSGNTVSYTKTDNQYVWAVR